MGTALKKMASILLAACGISHAVAFAQPCPDNFASTRRPYVWQEGDLAKLENYCGNINWKSLGPESAAIPAELFFYAAYHCQASRMRLNWVELRDQIHNADRLGLEEIIGTPWHKMYRLHPDFEGVPNELKEKWKAMALEHLKAFRKQMDEAGDHPYGQIPDVKLALKLAMPFLNEAEVKEVIRELASAYSKVLQAEFLGVPEPKLYQFGKEATRRHIGLSYVPLTDFVAVKSQNEVRFKIFSVDPIQTETKRIFGMHGIYYAESDLIGIPRFGVEYEILGQNTQNWTVNGRQYEAKYHATLGKLFNETNPALQSLDYDGLWQDSKLTGIIFPGANMGVGEGGAKEVMEEYKAYYKDNGFTFARPKKIGSFEKFLAEETKSGRLDYLLKEEHSGGSDSNFAALISKGSIHTGKRKAGAGKEEVVHIFFPDEKMLKAEVADEFVDHKVVGDWLKERKKSGGKQLFYVDTACYGFKNACKLSDFTQDENLVIAGSNRSLDTFSNDTASPVQHILDGVRSRKPFAAMDEAMKQNNTEGEELYLLPHSDEWRAKLTNGRQRPVKLEIQVTENGKPVNIETVGRTPEGGQ